MPWSRTYPTSSGRRRRPLSSRSPGLTFLHAVTELVSHALGDRAARRRVEYHVPALRIVELPRIRLRRCIDDVQPALGCERMVVLPTLLQPEHVLAHGIPYAAGCIHAEAGVVVEVQLQLLCGMLVDAGLGLASKRCARALAT